MPKNDKTNNIITFQITAITKERLTKKIGEITSEQLAETMLWLRNVLKW